VFEKITGVSGFIGFNTLVWTLDAGYRVRAIVRKDPQIKDIKAALPSQLEANVDFAVVEDMAVEKAFDHLVDGVSFILHIASPMNKPVGIEAQLRTVNLTKNVVRQL